MIFRRHAKRHEHQLIERRQYENEWEFAKIRKKKHQHTNSKRIDIKAVFCFEHLSQTIFAIRRQSIDIRQHRIQFERLSSFTSYFSSSSSSITARDSRENSSIFETINVLIRLLCEMRKVWEAITEETTRDECAKTKKLDENTLTKIRLFSWTRFWSEASMSNRSNSVCARSYFFSRTLMSFMFESSTISIISKITIETITKATKVVIESIEEEFASNEDENNWRSILNNVALSIEAKTIETTKTIETIRLAAGLDFGHVGQPDPIQF
jgi:hypothetical protein